MPPVLLQRAAAPFAAQLQYVAVLAAAQFQYVPVPAAVRLLESERSVQKKRYLSQLDGAQFQCEGGISDSPAIACLNWYLPVDQRGC
ncbi:hypothetical protein D3C84_690890 [compost metagenome]